MWGWWARECLFRYVLWSSLKLMKCFREAQRPRVSCGESGRFVCPPPGHLLSVCEQFPEASSHTRVESTLYTCTQKRRYTTKCLGPRSFFEYHVIHIMPTERQVGRQTGSRSFFHWREAEVQRSKKEKGGVFVSASEGCF